MTMTSVTPGDQCPGTPNGNGSPHNTNTSPTTGVAQLPTNNGITNSPPQNNHIQTLLDSAAAHQMNVNPPPSPPTIPRVSAAYSKLPDIFTEAIKPIYTGSVPSFFTFLFQLREHRSICYYWSIATYHNGIDLFNHFVDVDFETILHDLSLRWNNTFCSQIYEPGTLACASQLLFQVLTKSIQANIRCEVSQCLRDYPTLQGNGTAFWICLTRVIFPNTDIFTASIKTHICQLTLSSCKNDLNDYIAQVEDLLQLLGSTSTTELLPDLFRQLKLLPHYYFNKAITDLEQCYYLGNERGLTCPQLCVKAIKIRRIQEQAQQWDVPNPEDSTLQALQSTLLTHHQVIKAL